MELVEFIIQKRVRDDLWEDTHLGYEPVAFGVPRRCRDYSSIARALAAQREHFAFHEYRVVTFDPEAQS